MTRDQVRTKFDEIIEAEVDRKVSETVSDLLGMSAEVGPRPDAECPKVVKNLWKA